MSNRNLRWLYRELPELVTRSVITAETAERIRRHYGELDAGAGRRVAITICSILGALLIGAGIILLLAHNWEAMSRPVRTLLALAPLVAAQAAGAWILWKGKESTGLREGVGTLLSLAVAASIALVGQTYHVPGDLGHFLLAWVLLTLPVAYLLGATMPLMLYLAGVTGWAGYQQAEGGHAAMFWLLVAACLPIFWTTARRNPFSQRAVAAAWGLTLCLVAGTGIAMERVMPGLWVVVYGSLFGGLYLAGRLWFDDAPSASQRPFHIIGAVGVVILSMIFTFEGVWDDVGWHHWHHGYGYHPVASWVDYALALLAPAAALASLAVASRRVDRSALLFGLLPVLSVLGFLLSASFGHIEFVPMILFNLYVLALGIRTLVVGIRRSRLGTVNAGMLTITALIVLRFFDTDLDFIVRGIAFILIGIGFLATNLFLHRRMKGGAA